MRTALNIAVVLFFCTSGGYAQSKKIDSLLNAYEHYSSLKHEDRKTLGLMLEIADVYSASDHVRSIEWATMAIQKAHAIKDPESEAKGYNTRGWQYFTGDRLAEAIADFHVAIDIGRKHGLCKAVAAALNNIGVVRQRQGKLAEGFEAYKESLDERKRCGDIRGMIRTYVNMGIILYKQEYYDIAMKYYMLALDALDKEEDLLTRASTHHNIANVFEGQQNYPGAIEHFRKAINIYRQIGQTNRLARTLGALGNAYKSNRDTAASSDAFLRAAGMFFSENSEPMKLLGYKHLAWYYTNVYQPDSAIYYLSLVKHSAEGNNDYAAVINTLSQMSEVALQFNMPGLAIAYADSMQAVINRQSFSFGHEPLRIKALAYKALGDYKDAYSAYTRFMQARDSISTANRSERIGELEVQYKVQLTQRENTLLKKQQELDQAELARKISALSLLEKTRRLQGLELENRAKAIEIQRKNALRDAQTIQLLEKDSNIRTAQIEKQHRLTQLWFAAVIALMLITTLFVVLSRIRRKAEHQYREKNDALEEASMEILAQQQQLRLQNQELEEVSNEKNELLAIAAHDLKNPIGSVIGLTELLNNPDTPEMYKDECANQIVLTSKKMLRIVSDLLDIQKIESGIPMICRLPVNVDEPLAEVINANKNYADDKGISILFQSDGNDHTALGDALTITQVAENLLSNAIKFSPLGKMVLIHLKSVHEGVRLEISDQGPGLRKQEVAKLFNKFTRLSAQPTAGEISTGLGLYIVKRLVEAMNGRIWCESELGKGSKFVVEFPSTASIEVRQD